MINIPAQAELRRWAAIAMPVRGWIQTSGVSRC